MVDHLETAHQQHAGLDRREFAEGAVDVGADALGECSLLADDATQGADEELAVGLGEAFHFGGIGFDGGFIGTADTPLVEALQDEFAGAATGRLGRRLRGLFLVTH